jgi:RNA polymerase sigma factor (sigma-70 family)
MGDLGSAAEGLGQHSAQKPFSKNQTPTLIQNPPKNIWEKHIAKISLHAMLYAQRSNPCCTQHNKHYRAIMPRKTSRPNTTDIPLAEIQRAIADYLVVINQTAKKALSTPAARARGKSCPLLEELISECVSRVPELLSRYDSGKNQDQKQYMVANFKWYCYRLITRSHDRWYSQVVVNCVDATRATHKQLTVSNDNHIVDQLDSLQMLLQDLPIKEKCAVQMHDMFDFSYSEIAEKLNVSKTQARNIHMNGLRLLRNRLLQQHI